MTKRRPKGEGSITKLPSGNYKLTLTVGTTIDGKQIRKSVTAKTKSELMEKASKLRLEQGLDIKRTRVTFGEYSRKLLKYVEATRSISTYKAYSSMLGMLTPLDGLFMDTISADRVNNLLLMMTEKYKLGTVKVLRVFLKRIFRMAVEDGIIAKNPINRNFSVSLSKTSKVLNLPTPSEMKDILRLCKEVEAYPLYEFVLFAISTGMRKSEIFGLKWTNVDFKNNKILVDSQYTNYGYTPILKTHSSYRRISVDDKILEVIGKLPRDTKFVFECSRSGLEYNIKRIFKTLKHDELTIHSFRHYHATQLITKGVNVKVVSKRLGHSNVNTTLNTYVHWLPSMDEEASLLVGSEYIL